MDNLKDAILAEGMENINLEGYEKSPWDFGNNLLYMLCALHPSHTENSVIMAKTNIIGRVYAVQLERKSRNAESSEKFYEKIVTDVFKNPSIDIGIKKLVEMNCSLHDNESIIELLKIHKILQNIIEDSSIGLKRRSFCSKYLHFHLPNLFFIYDSRAVEAINELKMKTYEVHDDIRRLDKTTVDKEYASFFCKCLILKKILEEKSGRIVTPRTIDNILLDIYDKKSEKVRQSKLAPTAKG